MSPARRSAIVWLRWAPSGQDCHRDGGTAGPESIGDAISNSSPAREYAICPARSQRDRSGSKHTVSFSLLRNRTQRCRRLDPITWLPECLAVRAISLGR